MKLTPQTDDGVGDRTVGGMAIEKRFVGVFDGTSEGQMLAVRG